VESCDEWILIMKRFGKKLSRADLKYFPGISLESLRKLQNTSVRVVGPRVDI
jgi:hypothetical protein